MQRLPRDACARRSNQRVRRRERQSSRVQKSGARHGTRRKPFDGGNLLTTAPTELAAAAAAAMPNDFALAGSLRSRRAVSAISPLERTRPVPVHGKSPHRRW